MAAVCNLGRPDRMICIVSGIGMGIAGILVNGHPYRRNSHPQRPLGNLTWKLQ
jgi:hypothetical protein